MNAICLCLKAMPTSKQATSCRFSDEVKEMLSRPSAYRGGSMATVLEQLIREASHRDEYAIERVEKKVAQKK